MLHYKWRKEGTNQCTTNLKTFKWKQNKIWAFKKHGGVTLNIDGSFKEAKKG